MNQQKQFSVVEKLFIIMAWKLNGMCQPAAYEGWSDTYSRQSNREYWTDSTRQLQGWTFRIDDLQQVNSRDLKFLGFRQWEDETSMLLPLWLYPHMKKGETWNSLWGKPVELSHETYLDTRGGCLACWFRHEPVAVFPEPEDKPAEVLIAAMDEELDAEAEAWAASISGSEDDDGLVVHPFRDDEHQ